MTLPLADTISLKSIIYSLKKSNSKELCSQVSLTLELSRKYISKNFFQINEMEIYIRYATSCDY